MKVTRMVHGELMAARKAKRDAKQKNEALDRFMNTVCEIRTTLDATREAADDHFNLTPGEINWGHVGDAAPTLEGLKEILATIRGEVK